MEIKALKELAAMMQERELTVVEIKESEHAYVRLERAAAQPPLGGVPVMAKEAPVAAAQEMPKAQETTAAEPGVIVSAPTVGVFYVAPSPESEPFVKLGDTVKEGDVLCIIEAMKLMNEIAAESEGTIAEIYVGNGQVVEFGQPLFRLT